MKILYIIAIIVLVGLIGYELLQLFDIHLLQLFNTSEGGAEFCK